MSESCWKTASAFAPRSRLTEQHPADSSIEALARHGNGRFHSAPRAYPLKRSRLPRGYFGSLRSFDTRSSNAAYPAIAPISMQMKPMT